jgi:sugar-specific transcriptional regulator TrmB
MICNLNEDTQLLMRLGLTELQAEVYLTLARMGKATLKNLALTSDIDRANVHRVITSLMNLNLVEKILSTPTVFRALPVAEGAKMLLDQREKEHKEITVRTQEMLERYKRVNSDITDDTSEFVLLPDGFLTRHKAAEMVNSNRKAMDVLVYWSDFKDQTDDVVSIWTKLLDKGIKLRVIVFLKNNERLPRQIMCLCKHPLFEIRKVSTPPKATISIADGKKALLSMTPSLSTRGKPSLYVNNHCIVGLIEEYFELTWGRSKGITRSALPS